MNSMHLDFVVTISVVSDGGGSSSTEFILSGYIDFLYLEIIRTGK